MPRMSNNRRLFKDLNSSKIKDRTLNDSKIKDMKRKERPSSRKARTPSMKTQTPTRNRKSPFSTLVVTNENYPKSVLREII